MSKQDVDAQIALKPLIGLFDFHFHPKFTLKSTHVVFSFFSGNGTDFSLSLSKLKEFTGRSSLQVSDIFLDSTFRVFSDTLTSGGIIKVLCVPSGAKKYSNTALKKGDLYNEAIKSGAKGLSFLEVLNDGKEHHGL